MCVCGGRAQPIANISPYANHLSPVQSLCTSSPGRNGNTTSALKEMDMQAMDACAHSPLRSLFPMQNVYALCTVQSLCPSSPGRNGDTPAGQRWWLWKWCTLDSTLRVIKPLGMACLSAHTQNSQFSAGVCFLLNRTAPMILRVQMIARCQNIGLNYCGYWALRGQSSERQFFAKFGKFVKSTHCSELAF